MQKLNSLFFSWILAFCDNTLHTHQVTQETRSKRSRCDMLVSKAALESYKKLFIVLSVINVYARDILFQGILKCQLLLEGVIQQTATQSNLMIYH